MHTNTNNALPHFLSCPLVQHLLRALEARCLHMLNFGVTVTTAEYTRTYFDLRDLFATVHTLSSILSPLTCTALRRCSVTPLPLHHC